MLPSYVSFMSSAQQGTWAWILFPTPRPGLSRTDPRHPPTQPRNVSRPPGIADYFAGSCGSRVSFIPHVLVRHTVSGDRSPISLLKHYARVERGAYFPPGSVHPAFPNPNLICFADLCSRSVPAREIGFRGFDFRGERGSKMAPLWVPEAKL